MEWSIVFMESAKKIILKGIDNLNYGARPLKRKLEVLVENPISNLIISHKGEKPKAIKVSANKGSLSIKYKSRK